MRVSNYEISQRASRKAFAKITMLKIEIDKLKDDLKNGLTGGITIEELRSVYKGTILELQVSSHIPKLIELNE